MDSRWYHDWGYFLLYTAGWFVFAVLAWRLARRRAVPMRWVVLLLTTYAMGMAPVAHALYFLVVDHTLRNRPYVDAAMKSVTDWGTPTWADVGADVMALFESTGGLWGGPLAIVATVALAMVWVRSYSPGRVRSVCYRRPEGGAGPRSVPRGCGKVTDRFRTLPGNRPQGMAHHLQRPGPQNRGRKS